MNASKIEPMTFAQMKTETANDLRQIAGFLTERAAQIEEGDMDVLGDLIADKWQLWGQMLVLRAAHRAERREAAQEETA